MRKTTILNKKLIFLIVLFISTFIGHSQTTRVYTTTSTFVAPAGVSTIQVDAYAGGGGGGAGGGNGKGGGGGGGGGFSRNVSVPVIAGNIYTITVGGAGGAGALSTAVAGTGGTSTATFEGVTVVAYGGQGGQGFGLGAAAGLVAPVACPTCGTGSTRNGGNGGNGLSGSGAGGGGGAGGTTGVGGNGSIPTGGTAGGGGIAGAGGAGTTANNAGGTNGFIYGGGGGGGTGTSSGGAGAQGYIAITYTCPTYALTAAASASAVCGVSPTVVTLTSSTLASGTYIVTYNLTGATASAGNTASMTFTAGSPGTGTFTTPNLNLGSTTVTVTNLASSYCTNAIAAFNTVSVTANPILPAGVTIAAAPAGAVCIGTSVTFTATPTNGGAAPTYQWKIGATNVGTGSTYTSTAFANSDSVTCVMTSNATPCLSGSPVTSGATIMSITPNNTATLTSAVGTNTQNICINTALTTITYSTTGATGATFAGLPTGVTGNWAASVATISGTPSVAGTFPYTITLTGGCGVITATGSITTGSNNSITLSSGAGTNNQTSCISTAMTNITFATTAASGATYSGLPAGVTGNWSANVVIISGTPTVSGSFPYTVTLTGGCGAVATASGTLTINPSNTVTLTSAVGTNNQNLCISTPITNITYSTTNATGATFSGLPAGVTGNWAANVVTISGTPSVSGTFPYTVTLTGGCGLITATGTIISNANNTITLSSGVGTNNQAVCINVAMPNITFSTVTATGATFTGLPAGVTGNWAANVVTISGTPTVIGASPYTVTLTGGCGPVATATGTLTVSANNSITLSSGVGTNNQTRCINIAIANITFSTVTATGATFSGLPAGVTGAWSANVVTISGTPTVDGTFPYTVTLTGGCGPVASATGTITVNPANTVALSSAVGTDSQSICINTALTAITYNTANATAATFSGLPAGITGAWSANVVTVSGTPSVSGSFPYTVTLTGGCGLITATGTIISNPDNTITLSSGLGTNNQTSCINIAMSNITFSTVTATGAIFAGLPSGVTGNWAANVVTISGTPTFTGSFPYTVTLTGGCGPVASATGTITVNSDNIVSLFSAFGTDNQSLCINTPITDTTYATTGATGATFSGLPAGVNGSWAADLVTISGTPSVSGVFPYTVTLTGGCGAITATGTITVLINSATLTSAVGTNNQNSCINTPIIDITYTTTVATGANFAGLPAGVTGNWAANVITITGTSTASGSFPYTITLTGGCGSVSATGTITVSPGNTITLSSGLGTNDQTRCINIAISNITFSTAIATGATFSGLPAGVNGAWAANVVTISGTPTVAGTFPYTVTLIGGCGTVTTATGTITVNPNNTVTLTSAIGTNAQTTCINTAITNITYSTTSATGATFSGLPAGVTGNWAADVVTISGTPSLNGTFPYTVTLTGGCGTITTTGTIISNLNSTITLTSGVGTNNQTRCINIAVANITFSTVTAAGASFSGLPAGVTGAWAANVVTISGAPTVAGTFPYTVTITGGCGPVASATGTITVNPNNTATLTSAIGTNSQSICINTALTTITYTTTSATGATFSGLPAGVTGNWAANVATISGTSSVAGTFPYTITLTGGCGAITATGSITSSAANSITLSSGPGTNNQTRCISTAMTNITFSTAAATGATFSGLPAGVTGNWATNVVTISGTPTVSGSFPYTVTLTGGCGALTTATGTLTINPNNTITLSSAVGTNNQNLCISSPLTNITYSTTGATGATFSGLPTGVTGNWAANVATISGTPSVSGTFNYTVTLTGGCGSITATGTITVLINTATLTSAVGTNNQTICINTPATNITYSTTGATGATFAGLPAGVTGNWAANVVTISGTPSASGSFPYTVTLTGGCGTVTATGTITVSPANTITLSSGVGTNNQTRCINIAMANITFSTFTATGATFSGLPAGVTGAWAANVVTISGTPTVAGSFPYTVTLTGGCAPVASATGTITVNANNTVTLTSAIGTDAQTRCINTAITNITYSTTSATGATFSGLPTGVTGAWAANVVTISGTPSVSGTFPYTITLTGGCGVITATGTIISNPNNTITLSSGVGTNNQTRCINIAMANITFSTVTATGATFTGLPAGVTGSWAANVVTISGTPTASGTFNYTVTLTGGCGPVASATGTITVTPNNIVTLTSPVGTDAQVRCINTAITNITYSTTGATGATFSGLPTGVTAAWAANVVTISGTPTVAGAFSYTVTLTGGCGTITATGTITVGTNTITLTTAVGTTNQTVCINTPATNITYSTTGATGATFAGLPAGVTGNWAANVVTISGTPSASGTFNYTVTLTGGCATVTATGTITVSPNNTITLSSGVGTNNQTRCINIAMANITFTTVTATGATFSGLPAGVTGAWAANVVTISGTPTASGSFPYTVTLTGGCGPVTTATGTITVNPNNTVTLTSAIGTNAQTRCINTAITNITYSTTSATGATFSGLPSGVTGNWAANVATISGTPSVSGTFNYTITLTGGCGTITATGTITVSLNTATLSSAAGTNNQTVCVNTPVTSITYTTTGATGATFAGLPAGVTGNWVANVVTISGTPSASGTFNYTVTLTGGCGTVTATGTIVSSASNTITLSSGVGTNNQTRCISTAISNITFNTTLATGATFSGLPVGVTGVWAANVVTLSGTPTASGTFSYTITLTGGCASVVTATGTITVLAPPISDAGTDISTCATCGTVNITANSSATNAASVLWTSNGTGTFTNATSLAAATYTPSALDISTSLVQGGVNLTLTVTGNAPCTTSTSTKVIAIIVQTFNASGNFTVPACVNQVTVEAWGAGGKGGDGLNVGNVGGGGAGGAYSTKTVNVTPGQTYPVNVGIGSTSASAGGDSWFINDITILAKGGSSAAANDSNGAPGGTVVGSIGSVRTKGGDGANGSNGTYGGGGGAGAEAGANSGANASTNLGAIGLCSGGNGGDGYTSSNGDGNPGSVPGGGGGGGRRNGNNGVNQGVGGNGGNGRVIIKWTTNCTPSAASLSTGPGGVTADLQVWLRSDLLNGTSSTVDNTPVTTWFTQARGSNAIKPAAVGAPIYKNNATSNINFNPVIDFTNPYNSPSPVTTDLNAGRQYLKGNSGFFSQDIFIVVIPDVAVTSGLINPMDVFTGKTSVCSTTSRTGIGFGNIDTRFTNEVLSYTLGTTTSYGTAQVSNAVTYSTAGIINTRNNSGDTGMQLFYNGNNISTSEVNTSSHRNVFDGQYWIGRSEAWDGTLDGRIAEIITYEARKNDTTERTKIESYLGIKYGITLGVNGTSQNYLSSNGTTIWNTTSNAGFNFNIAGIGRDDASKLNQKQSKSINANSVLTIGLETIATTNTANTNAFDADMKYLVWGDNGGNMTNSGTPLVITFGGTSNVTTSTIIPNKKWKIVENGGDVARTRVSVATSDLASLPALTGNDAYVMIKATDSAFTTDLETVFLTTNGANQETTYDFDGTSYITFGVARETILSRHVTLDGTDDNMRISNGVELGSTFSFMSWVRPTGQNTLGNDRTIASKHNGTTGYRIYLSTDNKVNVTWAGGTTLTSATALPNAEWHNIAVIYSSGSIKLYIDGILDSTVNSAAPSSSTNTLTIGAEYRSKTDTRNFFRGEIDEFRLWDKELTLTEVKFIMNQEILQNTTTTRGAVIPTTITKNDISTLNWSNLVAYYSMNSFIGTHINDDSLNNNRGLVFVPNKTTISNQSAPIPYQSAANGLWSSTATWSNGTIQQLPYSLSIVDNSTIIDWNIVKTAHNVNSTGNKVLLGLFVTSNTLSATNDTKLEISHYLKLDGKIDLVGKSQLIQTLNSDLDVTSAGSLERDQSGQSNKFNYNYWSSPVGALSTTSNNNPYTVDGVMRDGTNPANIQNITWTTGYNGAATSPITLSSYWIYKFQNVSAIYANWARVGQTGSLLAGQGFTLKGSDAVTATQNYTFVGKPNNGTISTPIAASNSNLSGNPYPSAIDSQLFIKTNIAGYAETISPSTTGTLYFWEHFSTNPSHVLAAYQGGYATLNLVGGVAPVRPTGISSSGSSTRIPGRYIPVGQAFFVDGSSTGGNIVFNNSQRAFFKEDNAASNIMFRQNLNANPLVAASFNNNDDTVPIESAFATVRLGFNSANDFHRQILLGFMNEHATSGIDAGYDAVQNDNQPNDMYFMNSGKQLVIQGDGYFNPNNIYPLAVKTAISGNVKFNLDATERFDAAQSIYIFDNATNLYHDISKETFEIQMPVGTVTDRFSLRFKNATLAVNNFDLNDNIKVAFTNSDNTINVSNKMLDTALKSVTLYNMLGQSLSTWKIKDEDQTQIQIPVNNLSTGTYIVKVHTTKGDVSKKIIIQ